MRPSSIVVETGDQAGIVIHLAVLAAIDTEAVEELDEFPAEKLPDEQE
jgi:hypothetical protein